ncbi:MAG TPA: D-alanine--poly(phosphoribitol) ligase subunit DltA [Anaerolineales bacterium]|jgi:D-alanine--poly(phosphoribitol) ligase subunit 1|nr:D-alanine--poly(phosphoribitol) ligase subunit DltA [Anaerolineales bacterium]
MELIEKIEGWGQICPERSAHISGSQVLSYRELIEKSNKLASFLASNLPDDGSPIAILGHKQTEMLVGFIGCIKAGHPYIPLDTSLPDQRIKAIVETAKATLLTPKRIGEIVETTKEAPPFTMRKPKPDDPWYIIFTSGSTGSPKGVVITRGCLESFVSWILGEQNFTETQETFLNQAPFSFDLSVMDLYSSLATGGTLYSLNKDEIAEPKQLYQSLDKSNVSVWVSTPSFARLCLAEPAFAETMIPSVRKFWFCGETLAPEVASGLLNRFPSAEVWNTYGPTEATVATTSVQINHDVLAQYNPLPVGRSKPDSEVQILIDGNPVPAGERGEIVIIGPNVSTGYLHQPELTERVFYETSGVRAYRTGDAGHYQDGLLFFDGRMDFQIKLHGYRIEIGDIEANLQALKIVQDAAVIPVMKNSIVDYLSAFVILKTHSVDSEFEITRRLKRELGERLPDYMIPRKFVYLEQFPMTGNGKADRRKLAEMLQ